ncbi:hypothetical protein OPT61_g3665 [Boeremia exigua]|uniref:Uncharacterized protein n=1 Tax=Boeremia exigua TaxID=749465 RepID=A0ACC2IGZ9_9PLEO|nr:hypothetical protein OPT61_g3665 [Boeremia exigua]
MALSNIEVVAGVLCAWLLGFLLGLCHTSLFITYREAAIVVAVSAITIIIVIQQRLKQNTVLGSLNGNVVAAQGSMLLDIQNSHSKHITTLKITHNQDMRAAQDEIRVQYDKLSRVNNEYNWICNAYQDQTRTSDEQFNRIVYLEKKLKEFGQLGTGDMDPPFSAPASQINFADTPRRDDSSVMVSSPLSRDPMVQDADAKED